MVAILKVKQGSEWTDIPAIVGPRGNTGPTGPTGPAGDDGFSQTVTVTDITGGHRVTITDADGAHSFDVMDGTGSVQDVQVNGTSVVTDGVANVPMATPTTPGVVTSGSILVTIRHKDEGRKRGGRSALPFVRDIVQDVAWLAVTEPADRVNGGSRDDPWQMASASAGAFCK